MITKGDRVKLTTTAIKSKRARRHCIIDWEHRRGTVVGATGRRVKIVWDGRSSADTLVPKAVERVRTEQP